jgi:nucleoside-diphosphate-sugar epimerase
MTNSANAIRDVGQLEEILSAPTARVMETVSRLERDYIVLGVGGKMGPTLSRMIRRALELAGKRGRVIGVSRFSSGPLEGELRSHGIETIRCDLLNRDDVQKLPDAPNVIYMAGMKFGSTGSESLTWAMNAYLPALVCEKYSHGRIAAFSTGNVYGLVHRDSGGSREGDTLNPVGEYAMSCLGRERIFEHFSRTNGTPVTLLRLNYAVELRYGVLLDVARKVWEGREVDVTMGYANVIWQADANAMSICSLEIASSPPRILNIAGPELLSVRRVAEEFGRLMGRPAKIIGEESADALLSDGKAGWELFGRPGITAEQAMRWIAEWVKAGGQTLGKPTHFESRDGRF